jgi:RNA polymerase sigma-70 factor (ECF subfamily)
MLYATLEHMQPSPVITLNRAVAVSKLRGPEAALAMVEPLANSSCPAISTSSASRVGLLMRLGRDREARTTFDRAIALAGSASEAAHIRQHIDRLMRESGQVATG